MAHEQLLFVSRHPFHVQIPNFVTMVCKRVLTSVQKEKILCLSEAKLSARQIAAEVSCGIRTVWRVLRRATEPGGTQRRPGSGRKRATTIREDRLLLQMYKKRRDSTSVSLAKEWKLTRKVGDQVCTARMSCNTVKRRLKEVGLKSYVKKTKVLLNARQRKLRLEFCRKYKDWTVDDWRKVVFSDECNIDAESHTGRPTVWRLPSEKNKSWAIHSVNDLFLHL